MYSLFYFEGLFDLLINLTMRFYLDKKPMTRLEKSVRILYVFAFHFEGLV